jgi:hypothetical protein
MLRNHRRGPGRADRRRQQQVLLEVADVGVGMEGAAVEARPEPLDRVA